jgi:two-component system chemotaxis response regulator CheY
MTNLNSELAERYLEESGERLALVETCLLSLEEGTPESDEKLLDRAFRGVHAVRVGAAEFDLEKIGQLAQRTEDVMALIRSRQMLQTAGRVQMLVDATHRLQDLIENVPQSRQADIAETVAALDKVLTEHRAPALQMGLDTAIRTNPGGPRVLLVEDDFASRLMMQAFLSSYGECNIAVNGREAVEAFAAALRQGQKYDLICMDIMMPEMDGREAVRRVRALEQEHGILSTQGAKIVMTTAVGDIKEVNRCYGELCDGYLTKPIDLAKLLGTMKSFQLIR